MFGKKLGPVQSGTVQSIIPSLLTSLHPIANMQGIVCLSLSFNYLQRIISDFSQSNRARSERDKCALILATVDPETWVPMV